MTARTGALLVGGALICLLLLGRSPSPAPATTIAASAPPAGVIAATRAASTLSIPGADVMATLRRSAPDLSTAPAPAPAKAPRPPLAERVRRFEARWMRRVPPGVRSDLAAAFSAPIERTDRAGLAARRDAVDAAHARLHPQVRAAMRRHHLTAYHLGQALAGRAH